MKLCRAGAARPLLDRGFASSQAAALPELWFEAGDMHGDAGELSLTGPWCSRPAGEGPGWQAGSGVGHVWLRRGTSLLRVRG